LNRFNPKFGAFWAFLWAFSINNFFPLFCESSNFELLISFQYKSFRCHGRKLPSLHQNFSQLFYKKSSIPEPNNECSKIMII
jgi:hypothetical protein